MSPRTSRYFAAFLSKPSGLWFVTLWGYNVTIRKSVTTIKAWMSVVFEHIIFDVYQ